jgi:formyl-CoA transferase
MDLIGRTDLRDDPGLATNDGRAARAAELDAAIGAWTASRSLAGVLEALHGARVPAGRIYTARDIAEDPHYRARGMIERIVTAEGYELDVPGVVPKLSATPGTLRRLAPALGAHTAEVLRELGVSEAAIAELRAKNVIRDPVAPGDGA